MTVPVGAPRLFLWERADTSFFQHNFVIRNILEAQEIWFPLLHAEAQTCGHTSHNPFEERHCISIVLFYQCVYKKLTEIRDLTVSVLELWFKKKATVLLVNTLGCELTGSVVHLSIGVLPMDNIRKFLNLSALKCPSNSFCAVGLWGAFLGGDLGKGLVVVCREHIDLAF